MTMIFRTLEDSIVTILGDAAAGRFQVVGYKPRAMAAQEANDSLRTVQVFYDAGKFPRSGGSHHGPATHDITFSVMLSVAAASQGDLSVLQNESASAAEYVAALESFQEAAYRANKLWGALVDAVFNILMSPENLDLGQEIGVVSNRWIENFEKGDPGNKGEYVAISGSMDLACRVAEELVGDAGTPADPVLGAVYTEIETNVPDSASADTAPAAVRGGGI
jgi:hypothetical protein